LVRRQVALIAATSISAAAAAKAATTTIPVVFIVGDDPVRLGLVASLSRPGGNLTGTNFFSVELGAKRLELLREMTPAATRIAVLVNPANPANAESTIRDVGAAVRAMGSQIQVLNVGGSRDIDAAFASLHASGPTPSMSAPGRLSPTGVFNWFCWRRAADCPQSMGPAALPMPAG
jgi:ABC-type uncharacterized transport system substrate-binding protein